MSRSKKTNPNQMHSARWLMVSLLSSAVAACGGAVAPSSSSSVSSSSAMSSIASASSSLSSSSSISSSSSVSSSAASSTISSSTSSSSSSQSSSVAQGALEEVVLLAGSNAQGGGGLYTLTLDVEDGSLTDAVLSGEMQGTSYATATKAGDLVYAVAENPADIVRSFTVDPVNYQLSEINTQPSSGDLPVYVSLSPDESHLAVANYWTGDSLAVFSIDSATGAVDANPQVFAHAMAGSPEPRPHWVQWDVDGDFIYVVDLALDTVMVYPFDETSGTVSAGQVALALEQGDGPRHMTFHPTLPLAYVLNELTSTLVVAEQQADGTLQQIQKVRTLPEGNNNQNQTAHIQMSTDGSHIYVSNRGQNTIGVFEVAADGTVELIQSVSTEGDWPRTFVLLDEAQALVVANEKTSDLVLFNVAEDGTLTFSGEKAALASPIYIGALKYEYGPADASSSSSSSAASVSSSSESSASSLSSSSSFSSMSSESASSSSDVSSSSSASSVIGSSSSSMASSSSVSSESSSSASSSSSSSSSDGPVIVDRTECPAPPPPVDFASIEAYDTGDDSQKVVADYLDLMEKMPTFEESVIPLPYRLHQPDQAAVDPEARFPLVIYLHGGAEIGTDNDAQVTYRHAFPFFASKNSLLTPENRSDKPAYIVAPQCECSFGDNEWSGAGGSPFPLTQEPSDYGQALIDLIEHLVATYQIDPARIYVTGESMGGGGSWELAARRPDLIAVALPLSGHPLASYEADLLAESKVVVWANQGDGDEKNSINDTEQTVNAVTEAGGCAWLTRFPQSDDWRTIDPGDAEQGMGNDINHTVWMRAYMNPALWDWVFSIAQPTE